MKDSYKKLADKLENKEKLQDIYLKLDYEKKLLVKLFKKKYICFRTEKRKRLRNIRTGRSTSFSRKEKDNF